MIFGNDNLELSLPKSKFIKGKYMNTSNNITKEILTYFKNQNIDYDVYVIADTQQKTKDMYNFPHADESEFFSRSEFAEIASAIYYVFGYVRVFYSEIEFIEYYLKQKINNSECIVINFARDGRANGKKSLIPSFCDLMKIRYTGSNGFVISLLRNKSIYTEYLHSNKIVTPKSMLYTGEESFENIYNNFECEKVIVKNPFESASIGLTKNNIFAFDAASKNILCKLSETMNCKELLIQNYIDGIECEVLVLQFKGQYYALDPIEIVFKEKMEYIDTEISNTYNYNFRLLDSSLKEQVCSAAIKSAKLLGIKDYARFDFRIKDRIPYLFDIAGTPYTIYHSSIAYLFREHFKLSYESIYKVIVSCMLSNYTITQGAISYIIFRRKTVSSINLPKFTSSMSIANTSKA